MTAPASTASRWFRRHPSVTGPRLRLVCLPHAGGAASFFHAWGGAFGPDVEVLAARYPGRQDRIADPFLEDMASLADAVTAALPPFLDRPLALFGHSMGASLAYEVTLRLRERYGFRPEGLFVSGREAPHLVTPKDIHLRDDDQLVDEVLRLGGVDTALLAEPGLRDLVLPAIRSDFKVSGTYRAAGPVPVGTPVTAYVGDQDPNVTPEDVAAWEQVAGGGFAMRVFPGGHFYLEPERDALIRDIAGRIGVASS
ncbi:thioesterase II family protein [Actinacidiphila acidipaludis]|uniref:Thioesterase n=1 Tax=Actinacidiphila acidipaludis TaxID=2873382 RepID=A0ABS7Q9L0_9ACTN|nr:alpha/beta fold hydrolase [Streptomyces acidipaludis]MBY8879816.1 thioesterase [Streptomyces acidipaludis]